MASNARIRDIALAIEGKGIEITGGVHSIADGSVKAKDFVGVASLPGDYIRQGPTPNFDLTERNSILFLAIRKRVDAKLPVNDAIEKRGSNA